MRCFKLDNIRFFLIFFVVFGHLLELFTGDTKQMMYIFIYSFHMPVFIFITGYLAKKNLLKIFTNFVYPYLLFQIVYISFDTFLLKNASTFSLQFTTPYWLLWYLLACTFYMLLIPIIPKKSTSLKFVFLGTTIVLSLLAGFCNQIGYYLSLSRFFTFLPFFVLGQIVKSMSISFSSEKKGAVLFSFIVFFCAVCLSLSLCFAKIDPRTLYGSYSYSLLNYTAIARGFYLAVGFLWIFALIKLMPNREIPIVSAIGQNTLPIFLLHGFIVKAIKKYNIFIFSEKINILLSLLLTVSIVFSLGKIINPQKFRLIFTGVFIEKYFTKKQNKTDSPACN